MTIRRERVIEFRNRPPTPDEVAHYRDQWLRDHQPTRLPDAKTPERTDPIPVHADHFRGGQWDAVLLGIDPGGSATLKKLLVGK